PGRHADAARYAAGDARARHSLLRRQPVQPVHGAGLLPERVPAQGRAPGGLLRRRRRLAVGVPAGYFALTAALIVPVAFRRRWPAACLVTVLAVALVQWLTVRDTIGMLPADVAVL